jgi:hypothetical protein
MEKKHDNYDYLLDEYLGVFDKGLRQGFSTVAGHGKVGAAALLLVLRQNFRTVGCLVWESLKWARISEETNCKLVQIVLSVLAVGNGAPRKRASRQY